MVTPMDTKNLFDLSGRLALVTGASRGIGAATAALLAAFGAHVIVSSRKLDACEAVVAALKKDGGQATAIAAHIGETASIDALFDQLAERKLIPDILVNNAAANPYFGPMLDMPMAAFDKTVDVNIKGYFYTSMKAARLMRERGGGAIVNVASINGRQGRARPGRVLVDEGGDLVDDGRVRQRVGAAQDSGECGNAGVDRYEICRCVDAERGAAEAAVADDSDGARGAAG